jgi:hypothetical protein
MFSRTSEACASDIGRVSRGWMMAKKRVIGEEAYSPGGRASWEYRTEKLGGQCRDRVGSGESAGSVVGKNLPGGKMMWQDAEHEIALAEYGSPREQQRRRRGWTGDGREMERRASSIATTSTNKMASATPNRKT